MSGLRLAEPALSMLTGAAAEPVAGWAGILSGGDPGAVARTREALTYQPRSEEGRQGLRAVGEALAPVGEGMEFLRKAGGDRVYDMTGSPGLAAAAATVPDALATWAGGRFMPAVAGNHAMKDVAMRGTPAQYGLRARQAVNTPDQMPPAYAGKQAGYITPLSKNPRGEFEMGMPAQDYPVIPPNLGQVVGERGKTMYEVLQHTSGMAPAGKKAPVVESMYKSPGGKDFLEKAIKEINDPNSNKLFHGTKDGVQINAAAHKNRLPVDVRASSPAEFVSAMNESYGLQQGAPSSVRTGATQRGLGAANEAWMRRNQP